MAVNAVLMFDILLSFRLAYIGATEVSIHNTIKRGLGIMGLQDFGQFLSQGCD